MIQLKAAALAASMAGLSVLGCSFPTREAAVPRAYTALARPLGLPNARFFPDADPRPAIEEGQAALRREMATLGTAGDSNARLPPADYLAVSGGGDNGAFGSGLLNGWTETGTRPEFKMATGVSTGALIAPLHYNCGPPTDRVVGGDL